MKSAQARGNRERETRRRVFVLIIKGEKKKRLKRIFLSKPIFFRFFTPESLLKMLKINGKKLVSVHVKDRKKEMERILGYLQNEKNVVGVELYRQVWKAFFYCYWMADSVAVQSALAKQISQMACSVQEPKLFISCFWKQIGREWSGLDRYRLDKFYLFMLEMLKVMVRLWWKLPEASKEQGWNDWIEAIGVLEWQSGPDSVVSYVIEKIILVSLQVISGEDGGDNADADDDNDGGKDCGDQLEKHNLYSYILNPFFDYFKKKNSQLKPIIQTRFHNHIWMTLLDGQISAVLVNWKTGIEEEISLSTGIIMTREKTIERMKLFKDPAYGCGKVSRDLIKQLLQSIGALDNEPRKPAPVLATKSKIFSSRKRSFT